MTSVGWIASKFSWIEVIELHKCFCLNIFVSASHRCVWVGSEDLKRPCQRREAVSLHAWAAGESKDSWQAVERSSGTTFSLKWNVWTHSVHVVLFLTAASPPLVPDGYRGEDAWFLEDVLGQKDPGVDFFPRGGALHRSVPKRSLRAGWSRP